MQFVDMLNDAYDRTGQNQSSSVAAEVARRYKRYANRWNRRVLSMAGMEPLRRVTITKASVADQPTYGVVLQSIKYITETATQRRIFKKEKDWYTTNFPDPSQWTGTPLHWVPLGQTRIHTKPSTACELFIDSTEGADTGTVKVEAIRSNGYRVSLSKALTGTTAVSMSSTITDVVDIVDVRLATAQTGDVTLTQGNGGTELSKIPIGQTYPRFLRYALAPTPSTAITYTVDGIADIVDLSNDYDEVFDNADFHDIVVDGIVHDEWVTRGKGAEARMLLDGGTPRDPAPTSIMGRILTLKGQLLEWPDDSDTRQYRTFDQTIHEPVGS